MGRFAYITHPDRAEDIKHFMPLAKYIPPGVAGALGRVLPPLRVSGLRVESPCGTAEGFIISINITSRQVAELPPEATINRLLRAGRLAQRLGADIIGLGGHSLIHKMAPEALKIPFAGEGGYNIAAALESLEEAGSLMGMNMRNTHAVVLGAAGPVGAVCSLILARRVRTMTLVDSNKERINELAGKIIFNSGLSSGISTRPVKAVRAAGVVIAAGDAGIGPADLASGSVLCDLNRPPRLGRETVQARDDILVIEGGVIKMPCMAGIYSEPGFLPGMTSPFLAETIILALEKSTEKPCPVSRLGTETVDNMRRLARKHHFSRAGLWGPGGLLNQEYLEKVRNSAMKRRLTVI